MSEPTLYQEATDECVQGYGHAMMDSKCVGCGARNIFVVPVEPDYEAMANLMVQKIDVAAWWTNWNQEKLARELWRAGIGGDDE